MILHAPAIHLLQQPCRHPSCPLCPVPSDLLVDGPLRASDIGDAEVF